VKLFVGKITLLSSVFNLVIRVWCGVSSFVVGYKMLHIAVTLKFVAFPATEYDEDGLRNIGFFTAQPFDPADSLRELHQSYIALKLRAVDTLMCSGAVSMICSFLRYHRLSSASISHLGGI
jgi:hypothetical protein